VDRKTVLSALSELAESGFFVIDRSERFKPNTYKVIDHKEWAKRKPGQCIEKASFPWDGEGDLLGCQLYQISGGRVKFLPRQMTGLRKFGLPDEQIIERFRVFIDHADYTGKRWKHAYYDFYASLKDVPTVEVEEEEDGSFPDARDILRERKEGSTESSPTDSAGVQPNGHYGIQSNGLGAASSAVDTSSRSLSSRRRGHESQLTIPVPRPLDGSFFKDKAKEEKPPLSDQEWEERRRLLKAQAAKIAANGAA
jgi:hypothetical protein